MIHSVAGMLEEGRLLRQRPFRDPHHSASLPSLVGGGQKVKPGEISLAHQGVLFLDELPEFERSALEALRQPLETGRVSIARANAHVTYPARVQLVAAMNPCRCGYLDDPGRACSRAPRCGQDYQAKISGPLLDRIDLHVDVRRLPAALLRPDAPEGEASAVIRARVEAARARQLERAGVPNARLDHARTLAACRLAQPDQLLLERAIESLQLSARAMHRILRVARTIADLAGSEHIGTAHLTEALGYRGFEQQALAA